MGMTITDLVRGMKVYRAAALPVAILSVFAGGLYAFIEIAEEMAENEIRHIDEALFLMFRDSADRSDPIGPPWFEEAVTEITSLGGYPILAVMLATVVGFLLVARRRGPALYLVISVALGTLLSHALKELYERPRPDLVDHLVTTQTPSFPSGHATMSTVVYLTLAALIVRLVEGVAVRIYVVCAAVFIAIAVGLSRIYLGVHWPSDVAAGWALGVAWASLVWLAVSALQLYRQYRRDNRDEA